MKILRALADRPKGWRELYDIVGLSRGGLSYVIKKLKKENLIEQSHRGGEYYLTTDGKNELRRRSIIEGLEETDTIKILRETPESEGRFFADIIINGEDVPIGYLFYPSRNTLNWLPKNRRLERDEKRELLGVIETAIETIYDKPKTHFETISETFHVKLEKRQVRALHEFVAKGGAQNIPSAFIMCIENGMNDLSIEKRSSVSISENKERWPQINRAWVTGKFGNDIKSPYFIAMDLLEIKLRNEGMS